MKPLAATLFVLFVSVAFSQQFNPTIQAIVEGGLGFLSASGILERIEDFPQCLFAVTSITTELGQVIADLKQHTALSIIDALQITTQQIIPTAKQCAPAEQEAIAVLKTILGDLSNQDSIEAGFYTLLENYKTVIEDVRNANADRRESNWLSFGMDVGDIVGLFLWHNQNEAISSNASVLAAKMQSRLELANIEETVLILQGFVQGVGLEKNVTELPVCITSVENFAQDIQQAQELFNTGTFSNIQKAIVLVGKSFAELNTANVTCQDSVTQVKAYMNQYAEDFSNKMHDAKAVVEAVFSSTGILDVGTILEDYQDGQWEEFGEAVGSLVDLVHSKVINL